MKKKKEVTSQVGRKCGWVRKLFGKYEQKTLYENS